MARDLKWLLYRWNIKYLKNGNLIFKIINIHFGFFTKNLLLQKLLSPQKPNWWISNNIGSIFFLKTLKLYLCIIYFPSVYRYSIVMHDFFLVFCFVMDTVSVCFLFQELTLYLQLLFRSDINDVMFIISIHDNQDSRIHPLQKARSKHYVHISNGSHHFFMINC